MLGTPFVIVTVMATLSGLIAIYPKQLQTWELDLSKRFLYPNAADSSRHGIWGLFAFITSFDEVVVVLFLGTAETQTLPWQMFNGLREQISLTILSVATMLVAFSIFMLITVELLRRRSQRMRGIIES